MGTKHTKPCDFFHERFPYVGHMYEIPILRKLTIITMILMATNFLITGVYFYLHWDFRVMGSAFVLLLTIFELLFMFFAIITSEQHFELVVLKEKMWKLSDAHPDSVIQIKNHIKFLQHVRIVLLVVVAFMSTVCLPLSGNPREFFGILYLYENVEQASWYPYFKLFLTLTKLYLGIVFSNPLFILLYAIGDITYDLIILREKIRSIEETFGIKEIWRLDGAYQKFVELTLKRCIQEHLLIKRYHTLLADTVSGNLPIVHIVAVVLLTSFYFNVRDMNQSKEVLMKSFVVLAVVISFAYLFVFNIQGIINESENLYSDLCSCPWFLWNKSNQSMYFMLLIHTQQPLIARSFGMQYDLGILVSIARTSWSVITAIRGLTS